MSERVPNPYLPPAETPSEVRPSDETPSGFWADWFATVAVLSIFFGVAWLFFAAFGAFGFTGW